MTEDGPRLDDSWERWRGQVTEKLDELQRTFNQVITGEVHCAVNGRVSRLEARTWKAIAVAAIGLASSITTMLVAYILR